METEREAATVKHRFPGFSWLFLGCLLFVVLLGALFYFYKAAENPPAKQITIAFRFSIENTSNQVIRDPKLSIFLPGKDQTYANRLQIEANFPHSMIVEKTGNEKSDFIWDVLPPYSSKIISIKNTLQIWEHPRKIACSDLNAYLKPEPFIESDNPQLKALADRLRQTSPLDTARQIFDWVSQNMTYKGYVRQSRGALYALKYRTGDCTEYAALFVALCRAAGIPARIVGGFSCPRDMVVRLGDYHNWAEFYLDNRWQLADPQEKVFMRNDKYYVVFKKVSPSEGRKAFLLFEQENSAVKVKFDS